MPPPPGRGGLAAALLIVLVFGATAGRLRAADQGAGPEGIRLEAAGGTVTGEFQQVAVTRALAALGERTGVAIEARGDLGEVDDLVLQAVPVEDAIQRLAEPSGAAVMLRYDLDDAGARRLVEAHVVAASATRSPARPDDRMAAAAAALPPTPPPPPMVILPGRD